MPSNVTPERMQGLRIAAEHGGQDLKDLLGALDHANADAEALAEAARSTILSHDANLRNECPLYDLREALAAHDERVKGE